VSSSTVVFQAPNRIGLGHMSRLIAIALELRRMAPDIRTPFIVEGEGHGLIETYGLPQFNLPSNYELYHTQRWAAWTPTERHLLMLDTAGALVRGLAPDLVVFDSFPNVAIANVAIDRGIPVAFSLRKVKTLDNHFDIVRRLGAAVNLVLIPHDEGACPVPPDLRSRTRFVGTVVRRPSEMAERVTPTADRDVQRVVISGGGGGYPGTLDFYNLALEAFDNARARNHALEALLITGPLFKDWTDLRLPPGVRVMPFDPALAETFASAALVVCQAGYNTIAEIVTLGVPAIAVPAVRDSDDQFERAFDAGRASPVFEAYDGHDPAALGALMLDVLSRPRPAAPDALPAQGASRAAACLLDLLSARRGARAS
jgi:UDP-N-acetylglucosamine--N-acetylmuramyl-(pentapeptide) pyrophosphoryl-undecaprenol N-acetylglucosamine transferase